MGCRVCCYCRRNLGISFAIIFIEALCIGAKSLFTYGCLGLFLYSLDNRIVYRGGIVGGVLCLKCRESIGVCRYCRRNLGVSLVTILLERLCIGANSLLIYCGIGLLYLYLLNNGVVRLRRIVGMLFCKESLLGLLLFPLENRLKLLDLLIPCSVIFGIREHITKLFLGGNKCLAAKNSLICLFRLGCRCSLDKRIVYFRCIVGSVISGFYSRSCRVCRYCCCNLGFSIVVILFECLYIAAKSLLVGYLLGRLIIRHRFFTRHIYLGGPLLLGKTAPRILECRGVSLCIRLLGGQALETVSILKTGVIGKIEIALG